MNTLKSLSIKQWAADDRPREKMLTKGIQALSDAELLTILIGTGSREFSALDLAKNVLNATQNNLNELGKLSVNDLKKVKGIGPAKAINILAALELGKRRGLAETTQKETITASGEVYTHMAALLCDIQVEEFWVLYLNRANKILDKKRISQGGVSGTVIDNRVILKTAIEMLASSLIVCHNHPSGNIQPSQQDIAITKRLNEAAKLMDIQLLDHVIIADQQFYSFADEGML